MKITKANGKSEYALIESLKKRSGETDQKIVDIVTSIIPVSYTHLTLPTTF